MASCSLFLFFTTLVILLSTQTHARDSYFFGKFHRDSSKGQNPNNNLLPLETTEKTTLDESFPSKKDQVQDQDLNFVPESENGYGLYGHETTYNNKEDFDNDNKKFDEKVNGHETFSTPSLSEKEETTYNNYEEKYPRKTNSYDNNGYYNNEEEFNNNNNNKKYDEKVNGHETFSTQSLREKEESTYNNYDENYAPKKTYNGGYYNNEEEFNGNDKYDEKVKEEESKYYNTNAYGTELEREAPYKGYYYNNEHNNLERQGMSDTRFMEKGNYYYDLYNDKNHGHYYKKPHRKSPAGYYTSPATTENSFDQSYSYGNKNNEEEEEKGFKDPYNATWEKNVMDVEQGEDQFKP